VNFAGNPFAPHAGQSFEYGPPSFFSYPMSWKAGLMGAAAAKPGMQLSPPPARCAILSLVPTSRPPRTTLKPQMPFGPSMNEHTPVTQTPSEFVRRLVALEDEPRRAALKDMLLQGLHEPAEARRPLVEEMLGLPWAEFKRVCVARNGVLQQLDPRTQLELMRRHLPLLRELDPGLASRDFHYVREFRRSLPPPLVAQLDAIAREAGVADEVCR